MGRQEPFSCPRAQLGAVERFAEGHMVSVRRLIDQSPAWWLHSHTRLHLMATSLCRSSHGGEVPTRPSCCVVTRKGGRPLPACGASLEEAMGDIGGPPFGKA
jgi:hypothetical protein